MVGCSHLEYLICDCIHSFSISPCQMPFWNKSLATGTTVDCLRISKNCVHPGTRTLLCPSTRSRLKFSWKVVYFNPGCWVLLFVLSTKKQRQQFCNNKKKTHYLLNLRTRRTLFINFNLATFLYISVSYILWSTAGKCWDLRRPWHRFQCTMEASFLPSNGGLPI